MDSLNGICNLLFDLDGTLVDSRETIVDSIRHALQAKGLDASAAGDVQTLIGQPLFEIFTGDYGLSRVDALEAIDIYRDHYDRLNQAGTVVYPGVRKGLAELSKKGFRLFLATVKPTEIAEKVLSDLQLRQHFDGVAGASMGPERRQKSAIIAWALSEFSLDPDSSIMVGDRDQDIDGARRNGLVSVAVEWGFGEAGELEEARPDFQVSRFSDIAGLFKGST